MEFEQKKSVKDQAREMGEKTIGWILSHPKETIIIALVITILIII